MGGIDEIEDGEDVVKAVKDCRSQATSAQAEWRDESRDSYDVVAGEQWDKLDSEKMISEDRIPVTFNFVGTTIDAVSGSEINNRQEVAYIPREIGDVQKDEVMTAASQWVRDNCDAEDEESDSFWDVLVCGMGWTETRMDYEQDEEGKCVIERVDPLEMRWDPASRKKNLSDARWVQRERRFTKDEIESRWPGADIGEAVSLDEEEDEAIQHDSEPDGYVGAKEANNNYKKKLYSVIQHQWYEVEPVYKVLSPDTGQIVEVPAERMQAIQKIAAAQGMPLQSAKINRRKYKQAFVCGSELLESGPAPCQDDFTFQAITGKRDRNKGTWYGLVRPMKDPQKWANKFYSVLLHILNTNAKGGLMMEEGATSNPRKFEQDWAKTNKIARLNPGGIQKVQPKPMPQIPPLIEGLMHFSVDSIRGTSGVNLELLGLADREQAGTLENQRTKAGLTILAPFFGSLRLYRKRQGRVQFYYIQNYMSDGRLIRVVGEGLGKFVPLTREPGVLKYDVVVDDAPTSRDTKERTWGALIQILPMLREQGIPVPPEIIEYAPLPAALVAAWKPLIMQSRQPNPTQQAMEQLSVQQAAADVEKTQATADKEQTAAMLNAIKAQVESLQPMIQQMQMVLSAFAPAPGPGGQPPPQPAPQQPPSGGFFTPENGPTPVQ